MSSAGPPSGAGEQRLSGNPQTPQTTPGQQFDHPGQTDNKQVSRLGDYRIVKTLGEGSFGKVKREASQQHLG